MAAYLLDTSVLIRRLRRDPATQLLWDKLARGDTSACSALSVYEVGHGMYPREETATLELLNSLNILPVTRQIAWMAADESRRFQRQGHTLSAIDAMIGATALVHNLTLVTADRSGFPMPGLRKITL